MQIICFYYFQYFVCSCYKIQIYKFYIIFVNIIFVTNIIFVGTCDCMFVLLLIFQLLPIAFCACENFAGLDNIGFNSPVRTLGHDLFMEVNIIRKVKLILIRANELFKDVLSSQCTSFSYSEIFILGPFHIIHFLVQRIILIKII